MTTTTYGTRTLDQQLEQTATLENYQLRDVRTDAIAAQPCPACGEHVADERTMTRHELRHAWEGELVAYVSTGASQLMVSFVKPDAVDKWMITIDPKYLDASTNAVRVACPVCGDFLYLRADYSSDPDQPMIEWQHYPRLVRDTLDGGRVVGQWHRDHRRADDGYDTTPHSPGIPITAAVPVATPKPLPMLTRTITIQSRNPEALTAAVKAAETAARAEHAARSSTEPTVTVT